MNGLQSAQPGPVPTVPPQLVCPLCGTDISLDGDRIVCGHCGIVGFLRRGVWDFVVSDSYADSFGVQWARHHDTQLDSRNRTSITRDRFVSVTGWSSDAISGRSVLDAGSGAGRFSEIACSFGARVTAIELSSAAYTTCQTIDGAEAIVVRGNLLQPPLRAASFEKVFSIGVLQHTPDPLGTARCLLRLVEPGGEVIIWMYERRWSTGFMPKTVLRRLSRRLPLATVTRLTEILVLLFTPVAKMTSKLPARAARFVRAALPIASYWGELPLAPAQQREWSLLDTYDWLSPEFDLPQTFAELKTALVAAGASQVTRLAAPGLAVRAVRATEVR